MTRGKAGVIHALSQLAATTLKDDVRLMLTHGPMTVPELVSALPGPRVSQKAVREALEELFFWNQADAQVVWRITAAGREAVRDAAPAPAQGRLEL